MPLSGAYCSSFRARSAGHGNGRQGHRCGDRARKDSLMLDAHTISSFKLRWLLCRLLLLCIRSSVLRCPPESAVCWFWHDVDSQYIVQKILVNVAKNCIFLSSELCPICISNFRARFVHCFSAFIQNLKMFADRWHPAQSRFPIQSLYIAQISQNIVLFPIILCLNP